MTGASRDGQAAGRATTAELLAALEVPLGSELLERALMHRSFAYENGGLPTNERLEFLGDSVLGLIVTDTLFRAVSRPARGPAGQAARRGGQHARAGRAWPAGCELGDYVRLGKGEEGTGGRDKSSILADTLEAVHRRRLPRPRPGRGRRAGAPAVRPGDRPLGPAGRGPGLEDLAAGADRGRGARRARVPRRRERARPPEVVPRHGPDRRPDLRRGRGPVQEGSRAAGRRGGLDRDQRGPGRGRAARRRAARPRGPLAGPARASRAAAAAGHGTTGTGAAAGGSAAAAPEPGVDGGSSGRAAGQRTASPCPSCPRSRSSGAGWSGMWPAGSSTRSRCCTRAPCAGMWPGPATSPPRLRGRRVAGAAAPRQVPVAARRRRRAAGPPGHERPAAGRRARPRPLSPHVRVRFTFPIAAPTCASSTSGRSATCCSAPAGRELPAGHRAHRPRPAGGRVRPGRVRRPGCARGAPASSARCSTSRLVSGIGNIYADEALWRARLHWARAADRLRGPRRQPAVRRRCRRSSPRRCSAGGTSFDSLYVNVNGESGYFDRSLAVYGRERAAVPAVRDAGPAGPVHEPVVLQLPGMPAQAPQWPRVRRPRCLLSTGCSRLSRFQLVTHDVRGGKGG